MKKTLKDPLCVLSLLKKKVLNVFASSGKNILILKLVDPNVSRNSEPAFA